MSFARAEHPPWEELLRSGVAIFDVDYDAILAAMYALSVSAEGECYLCVPPDPGIEAAALGASESALLGTAPGEALHTFTLDSGASRCFFRNSTTLNPLSAPVRIATLQDAMVTTTTPGGQRVLICTCTQTGRHLATFTHRPGSSLYTLATKPPQVAASTQVSASGPVAPPCLCRLLSHQTLLWHHRLGHPSLPRLRGMHSHLLVSGLPRSLPPLPPSPTPPCLPCGRERYFLQVVDDYTRYTTLFPLRGKGEVPDVLNPWICAVRLQLREHFRQNLPVLRLHSDKCGEFSSDLLQEFCRGEGILHSFTLPASPQQNGIAERRIGLVMEVARTSMIHAAAPHFLWPFAVRYAVHQLNLWPHVSLLETSPTLRWTGKVGDALVFRVWGSCAFVRDTSADKLFARAIPCVFLGFPHDALGWLFYHPTSRRVFPSQDVTFDESVPFYCLFPYRFAPLPPPPLFLAPGPPPVDPLPPQGPAPSGVSQVDPLTRTVPVEVAVDSRAASGGTVFGGAAFEGAEPMGAEPEGVDSEGAGSKGAEPEGAEPGGAESEGAEPGVAGSEGAESGGAGSRGTASSRGPTGPSPRLSPRPEPLSPQQLCEWFARCTCLWRGAAGAGESAAQGTRAGGTGATSLGGAGAAGSGGTGAAGAGGAAGVRARGTGAGAAGGTRAASPGGARTGGTGAAGAGGAAGVGAGDPGAGAAGGTGAAGPDGACTGGAGAAGAGGAACVGAGDPGARAATGTGAAGPGGARTGGTGAAGAGGAAGVGAGDPRAGDTGVGGAGPGGAGAVGAGFPASPLLAPSPHTEQTGGPTERRESVSRPASPVCTVRTGRRVPRPRPPPIPGTHHMALRPSSVPKGVPLPSPLASSLADGLEPESDLVRAASPTVTRLLATVVTDPSFKSAAASALVAELVDFAAACCLDYAARQARGL
ncbi:unnamed protein product [Closterium sp. NIES-53]